MCCRTAADFCRLAWPLLLAVVAHGAQEAVPGTSANALVVDAAGSTSEVGTAPVPIAAERNAMMRRHFQVYATGGNLMQADEEKTNTSSVALGTASHRRLVRVQSTTTMNPMSEFFFESTDQWTQWPGLSKEITLYSDCVVLAQYQTASDAMDSHMLSRLLVDGVDVVGARSAQGNVRFASTFGIFVENLKKGRHTFSVEYRTSGTNNKFTNGGMEWQTRALNILALPEAMSNFVNPRWEFQLTSANMWSPWPGVNADISLDSEVTVLAFYSAVMTGKTTFLASKLYVDGYEQEMSRSVAGETSFAQNTGFFVGKLAAGAHKFDVKYRTSARFNRFLDNDWMNRALSVVQLPGADVYNFVGQSNFDTSPTGIFETLNGLNQKITLPADRYVLAFYSAAFDGKSSLSDYARLTSRMIVDGMERKQSRSRCGDVRYCQLTGMWFGVLTAGEHAFDVQYRTTAALTMNMAEDYQNRVLTIISLSEVGTEVASFLEEEQRHGNNGDDGSVFDVSTFLKGVADVEKQVHDGTAPKHIINNLEAKGFLRLRPHSLNESA